MGAGDERSIWVALTLGLVVWTISSFFGGLSELDDLLRFLEGSTLSSGMDTTFTIFSMAALLTSQQAKLKPRSNKLVLTFCRNLSFLKFTNGYSS